MQINNKVNGYILIWAIFLSVIIIVSFISISWKINKSINNYTVDNEDYELNVTIKSKEFINKELSNDEEIIFWDNRVYTKSLFIAQSTEIRVQNTSSTNFNIKINKWWPIFYSLLSFSWTTFSWSITNSGIVSDISNFTWSFSSAYDNGILYIKNLSWYSNFELSSSGNLITESRNYVVLKKIWNKKIIKKEWNIKVFDLWVFPWINYKKYWFEF